MCVYLKAEYNEKLVMVLLLFTAQVILSLCVVHLDLLVFECAIFCSFSLPIFKRHTKVWTKFISTFTFLIYENYFVVVVAVI
jgi:hypothetical protein